MLRGLQKRRLAMRNILVSVVIVNVWGQLARADHFSPV
jgi:hypothetical protein